MAALIAPLLAALLSTINIGLAVRTYLRERRAQRVPQPHALAGELRDIAAAIRERGPDLHVRLADVAPPTVGGGR